MSVLCSVFVVSCSLLESWPIRSVELHFSYSSMVYFPVARGVVHMRCMGTWRLPEPHLSCSSVVYIPRVLCQGLGCAHAVREHRDCMRYTSYSFHNILTRIVCKCSRSICAEPITLFYAANNAGVRALIFLFQFCWFDVRKRYLQGYCVIPMGI